MTSERPRILVTGASGFVGAAVCSSLLKKVPLRVSVRNQTLAMYSHTCEMVKADLSPRQDWVAALDGISVVVHCAARVHIMQDNAANPLAEFRRVNVEGTICLARQAADAGVRRFVFVSTVKVNGEATHIDKPFVPEDVVQPSDPYALSKYEAEEALRQLSYETGMEVVIIRPPLVYGVGVKANFQKMMKWLKRGLPLPLGALTNNLRSFVYVETLADLIAICVDHPAAANETFFVSDDEDLSTVGLLQKMGNALGSPAKLIKIPIWMIAVGAKVAGRPGIVQRLCGSLQVDIAKTKHLLGWTPPFTVEEGLRRTAAGYKLETLL